MAQDVELMQDKPSNACCAALKKKHTKLLEKYSKLEELKNKFRDCTALVQEKYDVLEKENESLKKALEEIKVQANVWKDEKEKEAGRCIDLEDEVSALQDEIRVLKQNSNTASREADEQPQQRLAVAEKEIKQLKDLLDQERGRAALEKKNAELEKKKADEALKKVGMGKNKLSEAQKAANAERKKAEENRHLSEKLKKEIDDIKSMLALEKSKSEAAEKKLAAEKQKAIGERKRVDSAVAKSEEQRELAETNLKKAMFEKDRADNLNRKLEEARNRAEKLEEEMRKHKCAGKLVEAQADESNTGRDAELVSDVCVGMLKNDARSSQWMEKMLLEKEHNIVREKKRADSEKKKANKQKKVAEEHKKMAMEQKHRADQLSRELESYKLRFEELQKELQEPVSCRVYANNEPLRNNDAISDTDTVKLLKKQLKLEKLLVKHAKKATEVEAVRNTMLHQELCRLKQECLQFQERLDILDKSFLLGCEGKNQLEKIGNQASKREISCSNEYRRQLISGIDSRMEPLCGGSNQKMLQSSAINSSSASFSDRPLVGSQERGTFSVMTSANMGEDTSSLEPKMARLSDKMTISYNAHEVAKADKSMRSPIKESANKRRVGYREKKRILDAVESIENLYSKSEKLHQRVSEKLSVLHGIIGNQKDEPEEHNLKETSCRELSRPCKKRKTSSEGRVVTHHLQESGEPKSMLDSDIDFSDAFMPASSPGSDIMKSDWRIKDGMNNIFERDHCTSQDFDEMVTHDHMKLLDLDNAADENSYRRAIAMPLSPMLPEVESPGDEKLEADNSEMQVYKSFLEGLSNVSNNPASVSSFHIIEMEKNNTSLVPNGLVPLQLLTEEDSVEFSKKMNSLSASDTHSHQINVSGGKLGMSDLSSFGMEESFILCQNGIASTHGGLLKYVVVSSDNKDNSSILRILQTIGSCMPQCSSVHSVEEFLQSILHTIFKAKDLSIKEKACVLFSLMLHKISEVGLKNSTNVLSNNLVQSLGSVTMHINSALSDPVLRRLFMESCDLVELFVVIEDFLLQRKVLVCGDVSAESEFPSTSKLNVVLDGNAIMLLEVAAPDHLLVAGGSLLASLCSAVDHIGFVCETSCNIIRMQKFDHSVMLAVLHAFAYICGSKYFTLQQYSIAMTVVKSLVMFLEKQTLSTDPTTCLPSEEENQSKIWLCTNCPFSEGAVSLEDVAMLLLENLQKQCHSESWSEDSLALVKLLVPRTWTPEEGTEEVSGLTEAVQLSSTSDENLRNFIDFLSLVEVLASFMSWDWTSNHLIGQLCNYLESRLMEGSAAAVIVLLGQLGRLGVSASGYENPGVKKLREWLSGFVCGITFTKLSLCVQFAILTSLFGLTPIKFEDIVEGKVETPAVISQSIPASFIREWFLSLSREQQSFLRVHQATSESSF